MISQSVSLLIANCFETCIMANVSYKESFFSTWNPLIFENIGRIEETRESTIKSSIIERGINGFLTSLRTV